MQQSHELPEQVFTAVQQPAPPGQQMLPLAQQPTPEQQVSEASQQCPFATGIRLAAGAPAIDVVRRAATGARLRFGADIVAGAAHVAAGGIGGAAELARGAFGGAVDAAGVAVADLFDKGSGRVGPTLDRIGKPGDGAEHVFAGRNPAEEE